MTAPVMWAVGEFRVLHWCCPMPACIGDNKLWHPDDHLIWCSKVDSGPHTQQNALLWNHFGFTVVHQNNYFFSPQVVGDFCCDFMLVCGGSLPNVVVVLWCCVVVHCGIIVEHSGVFVVVSLFHASSGFMVICGDLLWNH